jgi:hypothetical protein
MLGQIRRAVLDPETERVKDAWQSAASGHGGTLALQSVMAVPAARGATLETCEATVDPITTATSATEPAGARRIVGRGLWSSRTTVAR